MSGDGKGVVHQTDGYADSQIYQLFLVGAYEDITCKSAVNSIEGLIPRLSIVTARLREMCAIFENVHLSQFRRYQAYSTVDDRILENTLMQKKYCKHFCMDCAWKKIFRSQPFKLKLIALSFTVLIICGYQVAHMGVD